MFIRFRPRPAHLAMPDVCCDLVWAGETLYLAGPASRGQAMSWPDEEIELVNIDPLTARSWLDIPLNHLVDRRIPLRDINARLSGPLEELFRSGGAGSLVQKGHTPNQLRVATSAAAAAIRNGSTLDAAATLVNLSGRQLERQFADQFGLTPRLYRRIIRLRHALEKAATGCGLAEAALAAGYSDQSHFTRDVHSFMGKTPRAVAANVGKIQDAHAYAREY